MRIKSRLAYTLPPFLFLAISLRAQDRSPTNEQVVIKAVSDAALKSGFFSGLSDVRIKTADTGISRPISSGLIESMRSAGISVRADDADAEVAVVYDVLGFDFDYKRGGSRGFLRNPKIRRVFDARIRITSTSLMDGSILGVGDIEASYEDQIEPRFAELVKSPDIPELAPDLPGSGWAKIIEPVVVTAAVGGLVYLFFANR